MPATESTATVKVETKIAKGLATHVGQVVGAAFALIALVTAVLDGDHSQETITALILSAITFVTLMAGRFAQAYALLRDTPSPTRLIASAGGIAPTPPTDAEVLDRLERGVERVSAEIRRGAVEPTPKGYHPDDVPGGGIPAENPDANTSASALAGTGWTGAAVLTDEGPVPPATETP